MIPMFSAFFELKRCSREAKENIIFFVAQSSTLLSSGLAEGPDGAFGASRRS